MDTTMNAPAAVDQKEVVYSCDCGARHPAKRMFALALKFTHGNVAPVCGPCGLLARKEGIYTYPLLETLKCVAERAAKQEMRIAEQKAWEEEHQRRAEASRRAHFAALRKTCAARDQTRTGNGWRPDLTPSVG